VPLGRLQPAQRHTGVPGDREGLVAVCAPTGSSVAAPLAGKCRALARRDIYRNFGISPT
jgi:hypothetical protein